MQIQKISNSNYNTSFGIKVSPETLKMLKNAGGEMQHSQLDAKVKSLLELGGDQVIRFRTEKGILSPQIFDKGNFTLAEDILGGKEVALTDTIEEEKDLLTAFFDKINKSAIKKSLEFMSMCCDLSPFSGLNPVAVGQQTLFEAGKQLRDLAKGCQVKATSGQSL